MLKTRVAAANSACGEISEIDVARSEINYVFALSRSGKNAARKVAAAFDDIGVCAIVGNLPAQQGEVRAAEYYRVDVRLGQGV